MIQHKIEVINLVVDNSQPEYLKYVIRVVAAITAEDDDLGIGTVLQYSFDLSVTPPAEEFTPYDQLSKEQVTAWLLSDSMSEQLTAAYAAVDELLIPTVQPIQSLGLPWVPQTLALTTNSAAALTVSSTATNSLPSPYELMESKVESLIHKVLAEIEASKI
jgi:hypothetical protein